MTKPKRKRKTSPELTALRRELIKKARVHCAPFSENPAYTNRLLVNWMIDNGANVISLADKAGISYPTLYHALRGDGITTHTANCITKATGLQYESLFGDN